MSGQGFHGAFEFGPFCLDMQERVLVRVVVSSGSFRLFLMFSSQVGYFNQGSGILNVSP